MGRSSRYYLLGRAGLNWSGGLKICDHLSVTLVTLSLIKIDIELPIRKLARAAKYVMQTSRG